MRVKIERSSWGEKIDNAILAVSPGWAAQRLQDRIKHAAIKAVSGGFLGGRRDRPATKEWRLTNNSADQDILPDLAILRDRTRDLVRNVPLATGIINSLVREIGPLTLQARPDWQALGMAEAEADAWIETVEREFSLWSESKDADLTGIQNFFQLQTHVVRSTFESGDIFTLTPMLERPDRVYGLALQLIEADRVESPRGLREEARTREGNHIAGGIETDPLGAPLAAHVLREHPGSVNGRTAGIDRIPFRGAKGRQNLIHVFERLRPGQSRGFPILAPVMEHLKQLGRYSEAEVMAAVLGAQITAAIESPFGEGLVPALDQTAKEAQKEIRLGTGEIIDLAPGEKITPYNPQRPNTAFDDFMQSMLRQVGVAVGVPYEMVIMHFTASYSASRAAVLLYWRSILAWREFFASAFARPVFEVWMQEAELRGRINAPGFADPALRRAYLLSEWVGTAMPQVDPMKEVDAAIARINATLSTKQDETLQLTGKDWSDTQRQRAKEIRMEREAGTLAPPAEPKPQSQPAEARPEEEGDTDRERPETQELQERGDRELAEVTA